MVSFSQRLHSKETASNKDDTLDLSEQLIVLREATLEKITVWFPKLSLSIDADKRLTEKVNR